MLAGSLLTVVAVAIVVAVVTVFVSAIEEEAELAVAIFFERSRVWNASVGDNDEK